VGFLAGWPSRGWKACILAEAVPRNRVGATRPRTLRLFFLERAGRKRRHADPAQSARWALAVPNACFAGGLRVAFSFGEWPTGPPLPSGPAKTLNAGLGRGDAQSALFVRRLGLPWGLVLCGVRPDPRPKPAGVFACACYCRSCAFGSGFFRLALRARVGAELRSGFGRYALRARLGMNFYRDIGPYAAKPRLAGVQGFVQLRGPPGPSGPSGAGWLPLKHHRPHPAHAKRTQRKSPRRRSPPQSGPPSRPSRLAGIAPHTRCYRKKTPQEAQPAPRRAALPAKPLGWHCPAHAMLSQKTPQEAQPAPRRAASHPTPLAGVPPQASRRAFRPPAVLCAAPISRTQPLRACGAQSGGPGGHPLVCFQFHHSIFIFEWYAGGVLKERMALYPLRLRAWDIPVFVAGR